MLSDAPIRPKLIYLTRRNPAFTRQDWTARWRQHGALGMSLARWRNVARYVHCDLIEPRPEQRAYLADHDGIGLIWHRSLAHREAHFADTTAQETMVRDEAETFARPIALDCLSAEEQILLPPPADGALLKLTVFHRGAGTSPTLATALGHVRNVPLPHPQGGSWGLPYRAIEELWFDSATAADAAAQALFASGAPLLVLGREVELYRA